MSLDSTTIVVVEAEEIFVEFLERFSPERHSVLFAALPAEAKKICESQQPRLLVVVFADDEVGPDLDQVLVTATAKGARVIGLTTGPQNLDTRADRLVPRGHVERVVAEAQLLLEESGKARKTSADLKEALASMKPDEVVAPIGEKPDAAKKPDKKPDKDKAPTIETEPAPPSVPAAKKPDKDKAPTVETKPAPAPAKQREAPKPPPKPPQPPKRDAKPPSPPKPREEAPAKQAPKPPSPPKRRKQREAPPRPPAKPPATLEEKRDELLRLHAQVDKLTAELERTRKDLREQLDQRDKSTGVRSQIDELVWDLGEMRKEAQDARDALQKRLDAQDGQIRALEQQLELVVQGAREGSQTIGRTALLDSMKEEATSPRLHQLQLETPGAFLAPDVALGPRPVQVGGALRERPPMPVDEEAETGVFQDDAVTSRVDIDVKALLGDGIQPPPPGEQDGEESSLSSLSGQDPMFLLSPAGITGPGSHGGTPATVSVLQPFDVADPLEDDTVVEPAPAGAVQDEEQAQPPQTGEAEGEPVQGMQLMPTEPFPEEEESSFQEAEEVPLASATRGPRAVPTLEVDRPVGFADEASPRLPVPLHLLIIAGFALLALIAALAYYFWPQDPEPPVLVPTPGKARTETEPRRAVPPPDLTVPRSDLARPDAGPPPDLTRPPDARVAVEEPKPKLNPRRRRRLAQLRRRRARALLLVRAARLMRRKQHAEAREALTKALELKDDFRVRELMARTHDMSGELWPAAYHLKKAIALAPAPARVRLYDRLGLVMLRLGKKGLSCNAFKAAVAASPEPDGTPAAEHLEKYCK